MESEEKGARRWECEGEGAREGALQSVKGAEAAWERETVGMRWGGGGEAKTERLPLDLWNAAADLPCALPHLSACSRSEHSRPTCAFRAPTGTTRPTWEARRRIG